MVPIADLNLSKQQAAEATSQLVEVLKALVDKQAMLLSRPREEVYSQIMSLVRAQAIQPRFNPRAMYGIVGTDERRFFERILDLFRDFITAFVNNALDNILSSASSAAPAAQQTSAANPNSTASTRSRSMSKSKSKSRSKSQSDKDDDDGDDDGDDGDGDDSDK
ncbi:hypothetical protein GQ54DRAFT_307983 [Martensiomyces pterosporus]|nr:hypothetical protein GQ54DRAFT_307983 [Martensiomyces pterosporus]